MTTFNTLIDKLADEAAEVAMDENSLSDKVLRHALRIAYMRGFSAGLDHSTKIMRKEIKEPTACRPIR